MAVQLAMVKDEIMVAMEDAANPEHDHWFVTVAELKKVLDVRPEDVGKVWLAVRVRYSLPEVALKDALEEMFDQIVVPSDNFVYDDETFTVDELWDAETLGKVKNLLDNMLTNSWHFLAKTECEIDCSAFVKQRKEV